MTFVRPWLMRLRSLLKNRSILSKRHEKTLKILMDVGVGKLSEQWLADHGYDVVTVRRLNPNMSDDDILALAVRAQRLVVTMDKGFGERVHRHRAANAGVLLLRLDEANSQEKVAAIDKIFTEHGHELFGKFSVYKKGRLRIHRR